MPPRLLPPLTENTKKRHTLHDHDVPTQQNKLLHIICMIVHFIPYYIERTCTCTELSCKVIGCGHIILSNKIVLLYFVFSILITSVHTLVTHARSLSPKIRFYPFIFISEPEKEHVSQRRAFWMMHYCRCFYYFPFFQTNNYLLH